MNKNVLVVAAHPDDEILGCGASIARHVSQGDAVRIIILGEGVAARKNLSANEKLEGISLVGQVARNASKFLGVQKLILHQFPDNRFDGVDLLDIIHKIEIEVDDFKPEIIYTHHYSDVNIDHRRVAEAVESATRPMQSSSVKKVLAFEVPSSTEWNFIKSEVFRPNVFVDISEFLENKMLALEFYKSEMRDFPHPRSFGYIDHLASLRGGQVGFLRAEAFQLVYLKE